MRWGVGVASPARTSSTICSMAKPWAIISDSVQPSRAVGGEQLKRPDAVGLGLAVAAAASGHGGRTLPDVAMIVAMSGYLISPSALSASCTFGRAPTRST
jgi:hypothetical protein